MISYAGMHTRLRAVRGRASAHECIAPECGLSADEWALIGPAKFVARRANAEVRWSDDLAAYEPTCRRHNRQLDAGGNWMECKRGHVRAEVGADANGECRACSRERCRRYYAAKQSELVTR